MSEEQKWSSASRLISAYRKTCKYFGIDPTWDGFSELMSKLKEDVGCTE